ncbi:hypothetical protein BT69DRAFT_1294418 [Atractiella rhizophila]|nr:hypothetical protein BT69DRAFT_1294418 [Atractiella rhizophila]
MVSVQTKKNQTMDKYHGRRDISEYAAKTVASLFPLNTPPSSPTASKEAPTLAEWYSYLLYRTALPERTVFLALRLVSRLSHLFTIDEDFPTPPQLHYQLLYSATILATNWEMDDCYSNSSWSIASNNLFSLKETNELQFAMLENLDFRIREDGEETEIQLQAMERSFKLWVEERETMEQERARALARKLGWNALEKSEDALDLSLARVARRRSIRGF